LSVNVELPLELELTQAGINRDSDGLVNEPQKEPGFNLNRKVIKIAFMRNNPRLKIKKMVPMMVSQLEWYGTTIY
jgi:hypothetical protein